MAEAVQNLTDGRLVRGERSRQRIIAESMKLFASHGYAGTSLAAIREATGLPASSLHHHFGSKVGICLAAIESLGEAVVTVDSYKRLKPLATAAERFDALVRGVQRQMERERDALLFVIRLAIDADNIDPAIHPAVHRIRHQAWVELVKSLDVVFEDQSPPIAKAELETAARGLMVVFDGVLIGRLTDDARQTRPLTFAELRAMVLALLPPAALQGI